MMIVCESRIPGDGCRSQSDHPPGPMEHSGIPQLRSFGLVRSCHAAAVDAGGLFSKADSWCQKPVPDCFEIALHRFRAGNRCIRDPASAALGRGVPRQGVDFHRFVSANPVPAASLDRLFSLACSRKLNSSRVVFPHAFQRP